MPGEVCRLFYNSTVLCKNWNKNSPCRKQEPWHAVGEGTFVRICYTLVLLCVFPLVLSTKALNIGHRRGNEQLLILAD